MPDKQFRNGLFDTVGRFANVIPHLKIVSMPSTNRNHVAPVNALFPK
jgi:hypothetical protein